MMLYKIVAVATSSLLLMPCCQLVAATGASPSEAGNKIRGLQEIGVEDENLPPTPTPGRMQRVLSAF